MAKHKSVTDIRVGDVVLRAHVVREVRHTATGSELYLEGFTEPLNVQTTEEIELEDGEAKAKANQAKGQGA